MEWLRNNSFISNRQPPRALLSAEEEPDPSACYDSFKEHWQQAYKIIQRNQQLPSKDQVLEVVSHLEQLVNLLLYDVKKIDQITLPISTSSHCLEYLLSENLLDKLYEWGMKTGKYTNVVRLELLKFYELLVSQSRHLLLVHEPFLRPMLKLFTSCGDEVFEVDKQKRLVTLLYQLCVLLMQNIDLVDLFIIKENDKQRFIIFSLLKHYVHRDDTIGMQARDGLLLCMNLTKKNRAVEICISKHSTFCVLLPTGLSGLYSVLSHVIKDITVPDWHRFTPDDVNDIKELSSFITSLEFSNAVAQIAHPSIGMELQDYFYQGFLTPVLGPKLIQSTVGEQIAATAYLELIIRTVTHPGLLYPILKFLLTAEYDGVRLLNILMSRINSDYQLCLVSLALFDTLVDLNCEDVMLELVFQHLQPCLHLMLSQRRTLLPLDPHCQSFEIFLALTPTCCDVPATSPNLDGRINWNHYGGQPTLYGNYHAYLCDARNKISTCQAACCLWTNNYTGCEPKEISNSEENTSSLLSVSESSGYESLKIKIESNEENGAPWQHSRLHIKGMDDSIERFNSSSDLKSSGTAGPFLTIVLDKLKNMLSNTIYVNFHLTGLISRLAVYPQPLLRTYLLDHDLVLQPNVSSLFQIIGSLKQKIDDYMARQPEKFALVQYARNFLLDRETRLVNARKHALEKNSSLYSGNSDGSTNESFHRNGPKRRSITSSLSSFSSIFNRRQSQLETSIQMTPQIEENEQTVLYPKFTEAQHVALCAVLLDEWLKELAALAQEHTISQLANLFKS